MLEHSWKHSGIFLIEYMIFTAAGAPSGLLRLQHFVTGAICILE